MLEEKESVRDKFGGQSTAVRKMICFKVDGIAYPNACFLESVPVTLTTSMTTSTSQKHCEMEGILQ